MSSISHHLSITLPSPHYPFIITPPPHYLSSPLHLSIAPPSHSNLTTPPLQSSTSNNAAVVTAAPELLELERDDSGWQAHRDAGLSKAHDHAANGGNKGNDNARREDITVPVTTTAPQLLELERDDPGWQAHRDAGLSKAREHANNNNNKARRAMITTAAPTLLARERDDSGWQAHRDAALSKARDHAADGQQQGNDNNAIVQANWQADVSSAKSLASSYRSEYNAPDSATSTDDAAAPATVPGPAATAGAQKSSAKRERVKPIIGLPPIPPRQYGPWPKEPEYSICTKMLMIVVGYSLLVGGTLYRGFC